MEPVSSFNGIKGIYQQVRLCQQKFFGPKMLKPFQLYLLAPTNVATLF